MSLGTVFFALASILALCGAVVTISARSPIRGAVGLLTTVVGIALLFIKLSAQFLAAIQIIVYAGAIVVLFVFVMMLLGPDAGGGTPRPARARLSRPLAGGLMALFAIAVGVISIGAAGQLTPFKDVSDEHGSVAAVGQLLFTKGLVPFELATALLIVAVVGAIAVARTNRPPRRQKNVEHATRRLFHGPLHPRDAGRPLPKEGLL